MRRREDEQRLARFPPFGLPEPKPRNWILALMQHPQLPQTLHRPGCRNGALEQLVQVAEGDDRPVCEAHDNVGEGRGEGESGDGVRARELDLGFAKEGWRGGRGSSGGTTKIPDSKDRVRRRRVLLRLAALAQISRRAREDALQA